MSGHTDENTPALWTPTEEATAQSQIMHFARSAGLANFDDVLKLSLEDPARYWAEVLRFLDVRWKAPYDQYVDTSAGIPFPRWFTGGSINITDTALRWADDPATTSKVAIIAEHEDGSVETLTYSELRKYVWRFAAALSARGVTRGDRVGFILPNGIEAAVVFLGLAHIGAVAVPLFTGFGVEAIVARLGIAEAKCLIAARGFQRRGKWVDLTATIVAAQQRLPLLQEVIVTGKESEGDSPAGFLDWDEVVNEAAETALPSAPMEPDDPFMIIFTSGTTGAPKGAVHTHGGFPLKIAHDAAFHFDLSDRDTWFWPADMGWVVGPITVFGATARGSTLVFYDGAPDYPDASRFARVVSRHGITHLGASPTLVRSLAAASEEKVFRSDVDLSAIRVLITAGEVIDRHHMLWFAQRFGGGKSPVINYTGGTEVSGALLSSVIVRPIQSTEFNTASLGVAVDVADENGHTVESGAGELVIRAPFVGMTKGFWKANERYLDAYWQRFPDTWVHGDLALKSQDTQVGFATFEILGRSDDTLKIAGKRVGPAEVEDIATQAPGCVEAAAIGVEDPIKGQALVVFVVTQSPSGIATIGDRIEQQLGKPFRPKAIYAVVALPKTRNGKIMRRAVKAAYLGNPTGDISAMEDPAVLQWVRALSPKSDRN